ncbi:DUF4129 domain-containing protein [Microbacterium fluvii]|uniref:DUF4129 domain-containing protein n=1 Tax=Microbacterium fluvii TaxID=415215 RepID=A0ABW2HCZ3_9MICO|nr:DUF4129 domain-containing protein [Microbacterium fluvii]MCU4671930.1 DUF4129 domain-containing protein [Microbacterium fluvii]
MTPARRRTALGFGVAVGVLLLFALGSALAPASVVTSLPRWESGIDAPEATTAPIEQPDVSDDVSAVDADTDTLSDVALTALEVLAVVGIGALVIVVVVRLARGIASRTPPEEEDAAEEQSVDAAAVAEVVRRARASIEVDDDANLVVVRCWEALEALAADAGIPRDASRTASEYVIDMLGALEVPAGPSRRLADLYATALFSDHHLPRTAVDEAVACLTEVEAAVQTGRVQR